MRVQWSSEAAQEIILRMRSAERGLNESLRRAQIAREALEDANADKENKALNALALRLAVSMSRLQQTTEAMQDLIDSVKRADDGFQDAEDRIGQILSRIEEGKKASDGDSGREQKSDLAQFIRRMDTPVRPTFTVPSPLIMDTLRMGEFRFVDSWLGDLVSDPDIFSKL